MSERRVAGREKRGAASPEGSRLRRRPSGEPAPLPRHTLAGSGKVWFSLTHVVGAILGLLVSNTTFILGTGQFWDKIDNWVIDIVARLRNGVVVEEARVIDSLTNEWFLSGLRWGTVAILVVFKRWRHLLTFVGVILVAQVLVQALNNRLGRPRPDGIEILTDWSGFAQPSMVVFAFAITLVGMTYALAVPGRARRRTLFWVGIMIFLVGGARLYLGVDRLTDVLTAAVIGVTFPLIAFRVFTPDAVFRVSYARHRVAHLDLHEERRSAILRALGEQLGLDAIELEPFGLEGSGGSTPLRITLGSGDSQYVFAKLYALTHLRSDRWYKLARSLLYGALEDETPFRSVRKLTEREDYIMRLMAEAGVPGPRSRGVVEITPGREYLLVADFLVGTQEISEAGVDETVVDTGLRAVRAMWDAGLAHRDIKPANVLVRESEVFLIDCAFGEIRPSPWRQAVDLANMMLTLSLRFPAADVHNVARRHFAEKDIAEAFAATRGVTMPGELRANLREHKEDLVAFHRSLVPARKPIRIQRWTRRRISGIAGIGSLVVAGIWLVLLNVELVRGVL